MDTCCWELNGTPPFSRDMRSEGQLHQYSLLTSLLDPWSISSLLCTLAIRHSVAGQAAAASVTFRQWKETQGERHFLEFTAHFALSGTKIQRDWLAEASSFFEASGEEAGVRLYCREMDGSGTCCGLSLAPRRSYQLRLNQSSRLLQITFEVTPACLVPLLQHNVPCCWWADRRETLFNGSH